MNILVINCGSSSLKYQLIDMKEKDTLASGVIERIGLNNSINKHKDKNNKTKDILEIKDHNQAIEITINNLIKNNVIDDLSQIEAIGHRVVHGGEHYSTSVLIDENVKNIIKELFELAPLHNPANLIGIEACEKIMPELPQVAVFDTAFHQTMPKSSYIYSIPYEYYEKYKIRRYGFHGNSHKYVAQRCAEILKKDVKDLNIITCHLGNGASLCAIKEGKSLDTTMGFTPLEGLTMGTRSGDIDPSIITYLMNKENLSSDDIMNILNKKSGFLGISQVSSDARDIEIEAWEKKNPQAQLAIDKYITVVKKYIGAYTALLNRVDAIVFTAGLGEMGIEFREMICSDLEYMGVEIDKEANKVRAKEQIFSTPESKIKTMIIPTNEELMIAQDTFDILNK